MNVFNDRRAYVKLAAGANTALLQKVKGDFVEWTIQHPTLGIATVTVATANRLSDNDCHLQVPGSDHAALGRSTVRPTARGWSVSNRIVTQQRACGRRPTVGVHAVRGRSEAAQLFSRSPMTVAAVSPSAHGSYRTR